MFESQNDQGCLSARRIALNATESAFQSDGVPLQMTGSRTTDNVVAPRMPGMWLAMCCFAIDNSATTNACGKQNGLNNILLY